MTRSASLLLLFAAIFAACTPLGEEGTSISRGDQAFAYGDLEEALAEYWLAERLGATDAETYARIAHTYVGLRRIDEARGYYTLAVARDAGFTEQVVADFVRLARQEEASGDEFGMASAVQTALTFRPGISLEDLALPLAQHYSNVGEYGRALPFYQKTLSALDPDSLPRILFETAVAYDEVGDCESAAIYYEDYRNRLPRWRRSEVDWRLGNCSFRLAQAIGAKQNGVFAGAAGDACAFTFFPTKNLGGFGDGGMVTSGDEAFVGKVAKLRVHGGLQMYHHEMVGTNSRLDALQAAVLRVKLPHLEGWAEGRRRNAALYDEILTGVEGVQTPVTLPGNHHVYNQYTLKVKRRDGLRAYLTEKGIGNGLYYPLGLHLQECFAGLGGREGDLPVTEQLTREVVSLPIFPELTEAQVTEVGEAVREFYS